MTQTVDVTVDIGGTLLGTIVIATSIARPLLKRGLITISEVRDFAEVTMSLDLPLTDVQRGVAQQLIDGFLGSIEANDQPDQAAPFKAKPDWLKSIIEGGKDGESK